MTCFVDIAPWQRPVRCSGGATRGARALMAYYLESVPSGRSMGIYNCRNVGGSSLLSTHAEGRAIDAGIPVDDHGPMYAWLNALAPHAGRLGLCYVIFDRLKYRTADPCGTGYGGVNPHVDHAHIEITRTAADRLTLATLRSVVGDFRDNPLDPEEPMTRELIARRQAVLHRAGYDDLLGDWKPYLPAGDPDSLPGCDGVYGDGTRAAEDAFAADALAGGGAAPDHRHNVNIDLSGTFTTGNPR